MLRAGIAATILALGAGGAIAAAAPAYASAGEPTGCTVEWAYDNSMGGLAMQAYCSGGSGYYQLQVGCVTAVPYLSLRSTQYSAWYKPGTWTAAVWCPLLEQVSSWQVNKKS